MLQPMRNILGIHDAGFAPIDDLLTWNALPLQRPDITDPFIFLNHHGPQHYAPFNSGLPFGPHPHRGMETVTFIIDGDIMHKDSDGNESVITAGGVQWMTAGSGLVHAEVSSEQFKQNGGDLEILQLWLNLPSALKMTAPFYIGKQADDIHTFTVFPGVQMDLISGQYYEYAPTFPYRKDIFLSMLYFDAGAAFKDLVPPVENILMYVIRGSFKINQMSVSKNQLVEFGHDHSQIEIEACSEGIILYGHARPFNEPIVARGPFVMNTMQEIYEAYADYTAGKFGSF